MLIRVDPKTQVLSLLSLPRDLYVPIHGYGTRKINDAYANGGAPLAIKTVSQVLGVKINYYVPVNFHLFRKTVDTFPASTSTSTGATTTPDNTSGNYAAIDLKPGYQKLSGFQALQYVRYRHLDTDFMRTARQQAFVREFKRRLDIWSAGTNLFGLLDSLPNDLKVRGSAKGQSVGPKTILRYVKLLAEIPRGKMVQVRLSATRRRSTAPPSCGVARGDPGGGRRVPESQPGDLAGGREPLRRHRRGRRQEAPAKKKTGRSRSRRPSCSVVTVNGSGVQGVATEAKVALQKAGWPHTGVAGTFRRRTCSRPPSTTRPRARLSAERLRRSLGDTSAATLLPAAMSDFGLGADVVVAIGSAFSGVTAPPQVAAKHEAPPPSRPLVQAADPSDPGNFFVLPEARRLQAARTRRRCRSAPTYGEAIETHENAYRIYSLGKHGKALSVDARTALDSSHAWGLRYTTWIDAPILEQPSRQVCWDNRQVRIYTNGTAIHRIAVFYGGEPCKAAGGVVVWIDNSLDDRLSPETMIAIAKSLAPARRAPALILDAGRET